MKLWEKTLEGLSKISNVAFQALVTGFVVLAIVGLLLLPFATAEVVLTAVIVNSVILITVVSLGVAADWLLVNVDVARIKEEQRRKAMMPVVIPKPVTGLAFEHKESLVRTKERMTEITRGNIRLIAKRTGYSVNQGKHGPLLVNPNKGTVVAVIGDWMTESGHIQRASQEWEPVGTYEKSVAHTP